MERPHELRERAERYRQLAATVSDPQALTALRELAARYEVMAAELEAATRPSHSDGTPN
jgi:hypothetical protein